MAKYTIDDLMRVTGECDVTARGRTRTFYLRTLTHAEADARDNYANMQARALYRALKDEKSQEYAEHVAEIREVSRGEVEDTVVALNRALVLKRAAEKEIHAQDEPEPEDDALLTEILETEEQRDKTAEAVQAEREKWVAEAEGEYRKEVAAMEPEKLLAEAIRLRIDSVVNVRFNEAFANASVFYGTFKDHRHRLRFFDSPGQVGEADPGLRKQLAESYFAMDVFVLEQEELKN